MFKFPNFRFLLELSTTILLHVNVLKHSTALDHNNSPEAQPFKISWPIRQLDNLR